MLEKEEKKGEEGCVVEDYIENDVSGHHIEHATGISERDKTGAFYQNGMDAV